MFFNFLYCLSNVEFGLLTLPSMTELCADVTLKFLPPVTAARLLIKINIQTQCLAMLVKPKPKPEYAELLIVATSSRTFTRPTVERNLQQLLFIQTLGYQTFMINIVYIYHFNSKQSMYHDKKNLPTKSVSIHSLFKRINKLFNLPNKSKS